MIPDSGLNVAKESIRLLVPNDERRKRYLEIFLEAVEQADSHGSNKWGVNYGDKGVRLLMGNLIVCTIHKNGIWLALDKQSLGQTETSVLSNSELWQWDIGNYSEYKPVPSVNGYYNPFNEGADIWPTIQKLHFTYLKKVAKNYEWLNVKSQRKHSDALLKYLQHELGQKNIPIPCYTTEEFKIPEEVRTDASRTFPEGLRKQITVNAFERDQRARRICLQEYGFTCSVCGFNFEEIYGEIGTGYIHVHHLTPLHEMNGSYEVDPITDLRPVCPNCHAMLHKAGVTIDQLRKIVPNSV